MMEAGIIAIVVAVVAVLLMGAASRAKAVACPKCGAKVPALRKPTSLRQMFLGGWTCSSCGCEIGRNGRPIFSLRGRP